MKEFDRALDAWIGEVDMMKWERFEDGTPKMGKFETEQLYRYGKRYLSEGRRKRVVLENLERVGNVEIRERIYTKQPDNFEWLDAPVTVKGEDFTYEATALCSFPKLNGKVRYVVEDHNRLFIQRVEQLTFKSEPEPKYSGKTLDEWRKQDPKFMRGCPHCGYHHPPDGMCVGPSIQEEDPLGR